MDTGPAPVTIPAAFVPAYYVEQNPDLHGFSPEAAWHHYVQHGQQEGRIASPFATRAGLIEAAGKSPVKLEIGPFCNPVLTGQGVRYLDILDGDQLRARARLLDLDPAGVPEQIHYVGNLDQVADRFDAVISAHAIEHQPDLVAHLNQVAAVLNPGGKYFLIVPDKNYCFDHFLAESTIAQVVEAHHQPRDVHRLSSVIEHSALVTHNDPGRHWRGDHGAPFDPSQARRVTEGVERYRSSQGGYIDVHAWYFTPASLRVIVETLFRLGLSRLRPTAVYDTPFNSHEFCAVLEPSGGA